MNIKKDAEGAAGRLSNLTRRQFYFDGVFCGSVEGPLQAFKKKDHNMQVEVCTYWGMKAKSSGGQSWKRNQTVYWKGKAMKRESKEYQQLLDLLYQSVFDQDAGFRDDVLTNTSFNHTIGTKKKTDTILTVQEFTSRLKKLSQGKRLVAVADMPEIPKI